MVQRGSRSVGVVMAALLGMVFASEIRAESEPIAIPWLGEIEAGEVPPPLSVESLFSNSRYWAPVLSPSGNYLAVLHSQGDVDYVIAQEIGKTKLAPVVRIPEPDSRFARLWWANDDRLLVSLVGRSQTSVGVRARITRLFGVDRDGGNVRWLGRKWPRVGSNKIEVQFQDQILHLLPDDPKHVLIKLREASENDPSVKRMNVSTGRLRSAVARKRGIKLWFADHDGEVRVGIGYPGTSKTIYARGDEDDSFEELTSFDVYEEDGFSFAGYSFDPDTLYVYSDHEGRDALFEYSISNKKFGDLVYAHPEYDVAGLYFDLRRRKLVGVGVIAESPQVEILDEEAKAEFATIDRALPDTANRVYSASTDRQRMIIERSSDTHPPEYFLFTQDTKPKRLDFFLALYPDLTDAKLASMRPIRYRARDGLEIPGYLTLPVGRAPEKLPVIVYLHGGPSSRFYEAFDPVVQLFASRGFAVFQPNFRGSTGYGEAFEIAGFRQWGLSMQDDVTDGVKWLVELGIADPDRVGVYGASYGGYASLMGLIKTPQLFRAGASYAGVTDLPLLLANSEFYLFADHNRPRVGGGWGDKARLEQNSPLHRADEIRVPVLLGHGTDDPTVHVKHSARMARALERAGKSVEYMEFEDEAHGFLLESNRLAFYGRLASFFEEHLAHKPKDQSAQSLEEGVAPAHN